MPGVLYLFPDSNVFFQCQPLDQLDWSAWKEFDEIHVIVSRPVQKEIDKHKGQGSGRLSNRGRTASRLIREATKAGFLTMWEKPVVKLFEKIATEPTPGLPINYDEPDDRLVAIAHAFAAANPGDDVRLVTDDGGVIATAIALGFPYIEVPENWFQRPETTPEQKRNAELERENARLRSAEPRVAIGFFNPKRETVKKLEIAHLHYPPLDDTQIADLMARLREVCPVATTFGNADNKAADRLAGMVGLMAATMEYVPPTEGQITEYRDERYPKWLGNCQAMLGDIHELLNAEIGWPTVWFSLKNTGTRPGEHVLVTMNAEGGFSIMPPSRVDPDDDAESKPKQIGLPTPPDPPHGNWVPKHAARLFSHPRFEHLMRPYAEIRSPIDDVVRGLNIHRAEPLDPNTFYFRPKRPKAPVQTFALECRQWRHSATRAEEVAIEVWFDPDASKIAGKLTCQVECNNLSDPSTLGVPVRVKVTPANTYEKAARLVEKLKTRVCWGNFGGKLR